MTYTRNELARQAGVGIETLRYYERRGLLPDPRPSGQGTRYYPEEALARLRQIKRAQELGFSLREVGELLGLMHSSTASCAEVARLAQEKLALIDDKISELQTIRKQLAELAKSCPQDGPLQRCPIVKSLKEPLSKGGRP